MEVGFPDSAGRRESVRRQFRDCAAVRFGPRTGECQRSRAHRTSERPCPIHSFIHSILLCACLPACPVLDALLCVRLLPTTTTTSTTAFSQRKPCTNTPTDPLRSFAHTRIQHNNRRLQIAPGRPNCIAPNSAAVPRINRPVRPASCCCCTVVASLVLCYLLAIPPSPALPNPPACLLLLLLPKSTSAVL